MIIVLYLVLLFCVWRLYVAYISGLSNSVKTNIATYAVVVMTSLFFALWLLNQWQFSHWKKGIPAEIEISKNIDVGAEHGLIGGCGFAVFELSPNMLNNINTNGINALSVAHDSEYISYFEWQKTPYIVAKEDSESQDFWQMGMSCGSPSMSSELKNKTQEALDNPNSYYAIGGHTGLIVIPKLKIVVISTWK
jgi:hypothetical protein